MSDAQYPPTKLHIRLTLTHGGGVRIDHAYSKGAEPDEYRPFSQVPSARSRIRRVWNELRVLVAVWLERERWYLDALEAPVPDVPYDAPSSYHG